jgi:ABC-2 type transport system ATP-binding protein
VEAAGERPSILQREAKLIQAESLCKLYGEQCAIDHVSFQVKQGEVVGLLGPNGAGKSSIMRILTGFMPATSGKAIVAGFDVAEQPLEVKRRIGYLPEIPPIYPDLTVAEYLRFVARLKGLRKNALASEVERVVVRVRLVEVVDRLIRNLSKGFQQRVGLAQALLNNPDVLILDEPTVGLDPHQIRGVRDLIRELAESGEHTVILSTHILQEVTATCQRVIVINKGKICADAPLETLVAEHQRPGKETSLEEIFLSLTEL